MTVALLVPRRADNGHRDRLWAVCKPRWEKLHPDWAIVEGHDEEGLFNRSAALNRAAAAAGDWDVGVVIDSDVLLPPENAQAAVDAATINRRVTWGHRRWRGLTRRATDAVFADPDQLLDPDWEPPAHGLERTTPISWSCFVAVPREAWDAIGGFDERFRGWGWEDMAFQASARGLADGGLDPESRVEGDVYHLWHPRSPGLGKSLPGRDGIRSARLGRRYMIALRRDYEVHDRPPEAKPVPPSKDVFNLKRDDAKDDRQARRLGLPDWSSWYPTLEELRERRPLEPEPEEPEVKVEPQPEARGVALIVHTGGSEDVWHARRDYLQKSLDSLHDRVDYPWERKVIFSDWDPNHELDAIAEEYGFTIEGPRENLGYTKSMQAMWAYIGTLPASHVFATEDDFTFDHDIPIDRMAEVLEANPHLMQMALLRNPVHESEMNPAKLLSHPMSAFSKHRTGDAAWMEHTLFFTVNPMLMRTSLPRERPWPGSRNSEAVYGRQILRKGKRHAALWGHGEQWVTHIGEVRTGGPY